MNADELRRRVADARVGRLASVRADGSPHVVPVCFAIDGERILSVVDAKPKTTRRLARLANIENEARVSLMVDHYNDRRWDELWWVRADGRAQVAERGVELHRAIERLQEKYEQYRADPPAGPAIVIDVERWSSWSAAEP